MASNQYFDGLFEKLVDIHERLDTASAVEKEQLVNEIIEIQYEGEDIQKQWLILQEYIEILNQEYNLTIKQSHSAQENQHTLGKHTPQTTKSEQSEQKNEMKDHSNQVFWVADEESVTTFRKGIGYFELLMYENSVEYFKQTVSMDPNFMMARIYLGLCYLSLGQLHEAESELKKSLLFIEAGSPYIVLANHALGCIYAQLKKYEQSQTYFQEVVKNNPDFKNIYFNLGATFYNQQNYKGAKSIFTKGLNANSKDWELHYLVGKCDMFLMNFEQSIKSLKLAFRMSNRMDVGLTLGKVYEIINQTHLASDLYKQLLELYPKESEIYHRFGWLHLYNNDYHKALLSIKRALILNPRNEAYIFTLGWAHLHTNHFKQAEDCFDFIKKKNKDNVFSAIGLATLSNKTNQYSTAKEFLLDAIKTNTTSHELGIITYHLGYYWLQQKQYLKSLHSFRASLNYAPYLTESNFHIQVLQKITQKKVFNL